MNIAFKSNYDTILFHHIDAVSKWNEYISPHHRTYFEKEFEVNAKVEELLIKYADIRKEFGFSAETELFEWAYNGFSSGSKYSNLLPYIRKFELLKSRDGIVMKDLLTKVTSSVKPLISDIARKSEAISDKFSFVINTYKTVFTEGLDEDIICYLPHSPDPKMVQGGSNGDGAFTEVHPEVVIDLNRIITIYHEALHIALRPRRTFQPIFRKINPELLKPLKGFSRDNADQFLDEVVICTLSNTYLVNDDIDKKIDYWTKNDNSGFNHFANLWMGVKHFKDRILSYIDKPVKSDVFLESLTSEFIRYLEKEGCDF
ncbi:hypothetical protein K8R14_04355 [bacterium]|nr:hypothetical protein [bacterium]